MIDLGAASDIGMRTDRVFLLVLLICAIILGLISFLTVSFLVRYGRIRHPGHANIEGNTLLEISWTAGSVLIALVMFYWGLGGYRQRIELPKDAMTVKVTGRQWQWTFEYGNGKKSTVLNLPLNKPVKFVINAEDVLHGFYIPAFRIKQDAVPGSTKTISVTPVKEGTYNVFCTQYCGVGHSFMYTTAVVEPEAVFNGWLQERAPAQAAMAPRPTATEEAEASLIKQGSELYSTKGCSACHSIDGSRIIGPSWKGIYGSRVRVVTNGKEREVAVDDEYIKRSELDPNYDMVVGYPAVMPSQKGILTEAEITALTEYIKSLK